VIATEAWSAPVQSLVNAELLPDATPTRL